MRPFTLVLAGLIVTAIGPQSVSTQSPKEKDSAPQKETRPRMEEYYFDQMRQQIVESMRERATRPPEETLTFQEAADRLFCSCACGKILGNCLCEIENAGKEQRGFLRALLALGMQMKDIESVMASLYGPEMIIHPEEADDVELGQDQASSQEN